DRRRGVRERRDRRREVAAVGVDIGLGGGFAQMRTGCLELLLRRTRRRAQRLQALLGEAVVVLGRREFLAGVRQRRVGRRECLLGGVLLGDQLEAEVGRQRERGRCRRVARAGRERRRRGRS